MKLYSFNVELTDKNPCVFRTVQEDKDKAVDRLFIRFGNSIQNVSVIGVERVPNNFSLVSEEVIQDARMNTVLEMNKRISSLFTQ